MNAAVRMHTSRVSVDIATHQPVTPRIVKQNYRGANVVNVEVVFDTENNHAKQTAEILSSQHSKRDHRILTLRNS